MARARPPLPSVPDDWTVEDARFDRGPGYWLLFALGSIVALISQSSSTPDEPDVIYRVRRRGESKARTVKLPGGQSPDALFKTLELINADRA